MRRVIDYLLTKVLQLSCFPFRDQKQLMLIAPYTGNTIIYKFKIKLICVSLELSVYKLTMYGKKGKKPIW